MGRMLHQSKILSLLPILSLFCLGFSGGCNITIFGRNSVAAITVNPANPTIGVGGTQPFTATVLFRDGFTQNRTSTVGWASSVPAVATIDSSGRALALAPGMTTITAVLGSVSGSTTLTVTSMNPAISVVGGSAELVVTLRESGQTFGYIANASDDRIDILAKRSTGELEPQGSIQLPQDSRPVGLAVHPTGRFLYVANQGSQTVSAFTIRPWSGELTELPDSPFAAGGNPWSVELDTAGRFLTVRNPWSGEVSRYRVNRDTGKLLPLGQ